MDVNNDGVLDLSIANRESPNSLLMRDSESLELRDQAESLGLDLVAAEVLVWADHDGDGFQDAYHVVEGGIDIARNDAGQGFEFL